MDSLRGSSVNIEAIQRKSAWPLRKDDTHESNNINTILHFRGFDSSIILCLRGGILRSIRNLPEVLNQMIILIWRILVWRLAVSTEVTFGRVDLSVCPLGLRRGPRTAHV